MTLPHMSHVPKLADLHIILKNSMMYHMGCFKVKTPFEI
uniref:Uncharacterized protein n=1 Tax=Vitis vinifera TaxID=29760 RepID=F6H2N6_VITVI